MAREFRVISALRKTDVPVPEAVAFCADPAVVGAPFYIMNFVEGYVPSSARDFAARYDAPTRERVAHYLIECLAALHLLRPDDIGLADLGRPEGFLIRQVSRFRRQLNELRDVDTRDLQKLGGQLAKMAPKERDHAIVHGDYRLDNAVLDPSGRIVALLDWELATLGDPLADLGLLRVYWAESGDYIGRRFQVSQRITSLPGFPRWDGLADLYASLTSKDVSRLTFYVALGSFKLAVITANIHTRCVKSGVEGASGSTLEYSRYLTKRGLRASEVAGSG